MNKISLWTLLRSLYAFVFCFVFLKRFSGFFMLSAFLILTGGFPSSASERSNEDQAEVDDIDTLVLGEDYYVGVFVGSGDLNNRHTDLEGFANWGHSGSSVKYEETDPIVGILAGTRVYINGVPIRIEIDGAFGNDFSASSNRLDPIGLDETVQTDVSSLFTARVGIEKDFGPVKAFLNGGLAVARVSNSVIDIDGVVAHRELR